MRIRFILIILELTSPLYAYPSLLFTETEREHIEQRKLKSLEQFENLYLASILYADENHWSLWLNHQIIHATDSRKMKEFYIKKVTAYSVDFAWLPPHSVSPIYFTLYPNKMYLKRERRVIFK